MADTQKDKETRARRAGDAYDSARTGDDPSFVAVNTLPTKEKTTTTERITPGMTGEDRARTRAETGHSPATDKPLTEKIGEKLHEAKEDVKEAVGAKPETDEERRRRMETERMGVGLPPRTATTRTETTRDVDWESIQHPGMEACDEDPYATRPVSELRPPTEVRDKADLAAKRMLGRDQETMDRERIMTEATPEAAAARAALAEKEERERMARTGAMGAAGTAAARSATTRTETTRTETVKTVPPVVTTTTPIKPYGTMDKRARTDAHDESIHPDWETQPQINAPQDVGIPTAEGQADAARIRAGQRRSDVAEEPRIDRRGGDVDVPLASGARRTTETRDTRSVTEKARDKARDIKEDVDRKV